MKKLTLIITIALGIILPAQLFAVPADPTPKKVTLPDGTTLTIRLHGDEFLHWTTVGNKLVEQGSDGYYYYASFNSDGSKSISTQRVTQNSAVTMSTAPIQPPLSAIMAAQSKHAERNAVQNSDMSLGKKKFLVLLIEFSDLFFTVENANQAFYNLLNQEGYSANEGTGSSRDYYVENSGSKFEPDFDVYGPIRVSKGYEYYGNNDSGQEKADYALAEACVLADSQIDFSQYDHDGDGKVDNVFFYFAGHNEAEGGGDDRIWPHQWSLYRPDAVIVDGVQVYKYACASEYNGSYGARMASIGTFTHEFGHVIGLPDFYDTDYSENGEAAGLGVLSLMSGGSYNNSSRTPPYLNGMERKLLGWLDELTPLSESGEYTLTPIEENVAYMTPTSNDGEFFMYEYRSGKGWDAPLGCSGMAIYHIDQSKNMVHGRTAANRWERWSGINDYADHQCFDLIESNNNEKTAYNASSLLYPGSNNNTDFSFSSKPSAQDWQGEDTGYALNYIQDEGGQLTFTLRVSTNRSISGKVVNNKNNVVPGAEITITTTGTDGDASEMTLSSDTQGLFTADISEMNGKNVTVVCRHSAYKEYTTSFELINGKKELKITLESSGISGFNNIVSPKSEYTSGETFTFALTEGTLVPVSVVWYFDGAVQSGSSVTLTSGEHVIKALLTHEDGSKETVVQEIKVQ